MSFVVSCQCGKRFKVADDQRGRKAKCPGCGTTLRLMPEGAAAAPARPAPPPPPPEESDPFANFDLEAAAEMERNAAIDENQAPRAAPPPMPLPTPSGRPLPPALSYATPAPAGQVNLGEVATRQKGVIYCLLVYIALVIARFVVPPELQLIPAIAALAASVTAAVFVFMLAIHLYGTGTGILLGILTLIPCIGLIVLLMVNGKATSVLKQNGIHVGFLGASSSQIPAPGVRR